MTGLPSGAPGAPVTSANAGTAAGVEYQRTTLTNPGVTAAPYERTLVTHPGVGSAPLVQPPPPPRTSASDAGVGPAFAVTMASTPPAAPALLGDLDSLGASVDAMQKKAADEEAQAMTALRKNATRSKDWDLLASGLSAAQEPAAPAAATASSISRTSGSVFDLLQKQSGATLKEQASAKGAENHSAALVFDAKMRACYGFLAEFFRAANAANPVYAGRHSLPLFGDFPPLHLTEGIVNTRTKRIESGGKTVDVIEHLLVSYSLVAVERRRAAFHAPDLVKYKALLDEQEMKYKMSETRNAAGQVTHAGFDVEPRVNCALTMRADITGAAVDILCRNIGPLGRRQYRIRVALLGDAVFEELSKMMLGHFSDLLARHAAR